MTDLNTMSFFYLNCLKAEIKKVADMGALLASSGLVSRWYMDAYLPDDLQIDAWEQSGWEIFPAQKYIYNRIFPKNVFTDNVYDIVFFLFNAEEISLEALRWAMCHGKQLIFDENL